MFGGVEAGAGVMARHMKLVGSGQTGDDESGQGEIVRSY